MKVKPEVKADIELRDRIDWVLDYDPEVRSTDIGVTTKDGTVTLTGYVETYAEKLAAEAAVKRVYGVKAIANDIEVKPILQKTDTGIAEAALNALEARIDVPDDNVRVTVKNGWVYLDGKVDWRYQKEAAESAVRKLAGVMGVTNQINITPRRIYYRGEDKDRRRYQAKR